MDIPKEFLDMVEKDIERIDESINKTAADRIDLFRELDGKYQACIKDWLLNMCCVHPTHHEIVYAYMQHNDDNTKHNLKMAKAKLESFKFGVNVVDLPTSPKTEININNDIRLNITFDEVRSQVEDMTSLSEKETEELLQRIDKLEEIINSKDNKKTKWQKVAPILKWLADKSFDVAMKVLPLILKLQEQ